MVPSVAVMVCCPWDAASGTWKVALKPPAELEVTIGGVVTTDEPSNVILIVEFGANEVPVTVTSVPAEPLAGEA